MLCGDGDAFLLPPAYAVSASDEAQGSSGGTLEKGFAVSGVVTSFAKWLE
jgi:hypothetical protein